MRPHPHTHLPTYPHIHTSTHPHTHTRVSQTCAARIPSASAPTEGQARVVRGSNAAIARTAALAPAAAIIGAVDIATMTAMLAITKFARYCTHRVNIATL